jgi:hypothetical protein
MPPLAPIAFNRRLRLAWLEEGLRLLATGEAKEPWTRCMEDTIRLEAKGRDSIAKSLRYVRHIWWPVGDARTGLRDQAIALYKSNETGPELIKLLCWGALIAAYPFVFQVATLTGRLLHLQESFKLEQALRALRDQLGERETVKRSGRYAISLIEDFGFIRSSKAAGFYERGPTMPLCSGELAAWLLASIFVASSVDRMDTREVLAHHGNFFCSSQALLNGALASPHFVRKTVSYSTEWIVLKPSISSP